MIKKSEFELLVMDYLKEHQGCSYKRAANLLKVVARLKWERECLKTGKEPYTTEVTYFTMKRA